MGVVNPREMGLLVALVAAIGFPAAPAAAQGPSFNCSRAAPGSIERMVCDDAELSALAVSS